VIDHKSESIRVGRTFVFSKRLLLTGPAILAETGCMSSPKEDILLAASGHQQQLTEGMYEGIARYCGR
jgi:N-acetylmuramoyl-L-alanine amidase